MDLYILRHGDAGPNRTSAADDDVRELTEEGVAGVRPVLGAAKDAGLLAPSIILCSPLSRAKQTAHVVKEVWQGSGDIETTSTLVRGEILAMMAEVASQYPQHHSVLIAGHEPSLSAFASAVLAGSER